MDKGSIIEGPKCCQGLNKIILREVEFRFLYVFDLAIDSQIFFNPLLQSDEICNAVVETYRV